MLKKIVLIAVGTLLLSGCSLTPTKTAAPVTGNSVAVVSEKGSFWKSEDGGVTFAPKVKVDEKRSITSADILSFEFRPEPVTDPSNPPKFTSTMYIGTIKDGIFKTSDAGETWEQLTFPPQKVYGLTIDRINPDRMFATGVLTDRARIYRSEDAGANWKEVYTEPGTKTVITSLAERPDNTDILFAGTSTGMVIKSTDGGNTWKNVGQAPGALTQMSFDSGNAFAVYALVFNSELLYSGDGGATWTDWRQERADDMAKNQKTTQNNPTNDPLQQKRSAEVPSSVLAFAVDRSVSGTLYAGTMNSGLYRSHDFGKNWESVQIIGSAKMMPIRSVATNPRNQNEIVFFSGPVFYKSLDGGTTWSTTQLGIDRGVSVLQYDPIAPDILYIGLRAFSQ